MEDEFSLHLFFLSVLTKRYTDMFWLVDNSLPPEQFSQLKSNLSGIITVNEVGRSSHRLGLAQFGQDVQVEFLLNTYENKGQILEAVGNFKLQPQAKQQRNLSRALELATTRFFKAEAGGRAHMGVHQDLVIVMENEQNSLSMLLYGDSASYARTLKDFGVATSVMAEGSMGLPEFQISGLAFNWLEFGPKGFKILSDKIFFPGVETVVEGKNISSVLYCTVDRSDGPVQERDTDQYLYVMLRRTPDQTQTCPQEGFKVGKPDYQAVTSNTSFDYFGFWRMKQSGRPLTEGCRFGSCLACPCVKVSLGETQNVPLLLAPSVLMCEQD